MACSSASLAARLAHPDGASVMFCEHGQVREQVEGLEDHADLGADGVDVAHVVGELDAVDDDVAALMLLQPVDACG